MDVESLAAAAWGKRAVVLAAFGFVGVGALVGAMSIYFLYLRHKIEQHFNIKATITEEIKQLKEDVKLVTSRSSIHQISDNTHKSKKPKAKVLKDSSTNDRKSVMHELPDNIETDQDDQAVTVPTSPSKSQAFEPPLPPSTASTSSTTKKQPEEAPASSPPPGPTASATNENPELAFYDEIDAQLDGNPISQHEAYNRLKINQDRLRSSCGLWWRLAKATHLEALAAKNNGDNVLRKTLVFAAFAAAEKALKLNDRSADAHKWYGITVGSKGDFLSTNEKIKNGFIFKEHIDRAVSLNPNDCTLHHLLGRFNYEVSQLSWMERKLAATLFSAPPTATMGEALERFLTAEAKGKPFKENRLYIAKCYIALSDNANAAKWLQMAANLPPISAQDRLAQEDINKLLPKYRKYL